MRCCGSGFGFVEIGTVTPKPQVGNPRPRLFRLERDEAVINRMGFNNDGAEVVLRRLAARANHGGIVGVNVGANKDSTDRVADYVKLIETFAPVASYFTVNVSSPNTPGLRNLQQSAALDDLLAKVIDARERVRRNAGNSPVLLKIAPDLSLSELDDVVHIARSRRVDGMIVANTTLARPSTLREQGRAKEQGGLSGRPLFRLSTRMVAETYVRAEGAFPLIGVGGIDTGGAALTKIRAGASLIQLYSSLVYKGLGLVEDIKNDLASTLLRTGTRLAVGDRRRRCRDDYGRGLAGGVISCPGCSAARRSCGVVRCWSGGPCPVTVPALRSVTSCRTASGTREQWSSSLPQTTSSTTPDNAAPPVRRGRHSAPAARPIVRHCRTTAAQTMR